MTEVHESKGSVVKNCLVILFAVLACPVWAVSFPCDKAVSPTEKTICSNAEIGQLDDMLFKNYNSMKAAFKEAGTGGEVNLKNAQNEWIAKSNDCGNDVNCLKSIYIERINTICDEAIAPGVFPQNCVTVPTDTLTKSDAELGLTPYDQANDPSNAPAPAPQPQQSNQLPFEVKVNGNAFFITSLENNLTLNQVIPNRGNCPAIDYVDKRAKALAWSMKNDPRQVEASRRMGVINYGEIKTDYAGNCVIRELVINTNLGSWTVTFNQ